jgi:oxygen-independent coproporphyrinogen-3 oxidase
MEFRSQRLTEPPSAKTLYIGGGTPSLLHPQLVESLVESSRRLYILEDNAEITLEANPGTVTAESLAGYRSAGINRLSIGVQSLDDSILALLGRIHSAEQAREAVSLARTAGFDNIGIDLIHSLPEQTLDHWKRTLSDAISLGPDHISSYGLSIEDGTPFSEMADRDEISLPGNDESAAMYEETMSALASAGFEHYEIANFAQSGKRSRHNQVYWRRGNYLGFGAGAHSFLREPGFGQRWSSTAGVEEYCRTCSAILQDETSEILSKHDAMGEFIFLGLRLLEGVHPEQFRAEFGLSMEEAFPGVLERHIANGLLLKKGGDIFLSRKGILLANQVFTDFA